MTLTSLKSQGLPFLRRVFRVFKDAAPAAPITEAERYLQDLTPGGAGVAEAVIDRALLDLTKLEELAKRPSNEISLDDASQCFTELNAYMLDGGLSDFDLLFLPAVIRITLNFAARTAHAPELHTWLLRRAQQDFKRLWLSLAGLRLNPFSLGFPVEMAGFKNEFSLLLSSLVGPKGAILVQGAPGSGKTSFLRKSCGSLLSHQIEQRQIVTTYFENKRASAKQFATDVYAGFFNTYLMEIPYLKDALQNTLPSVAEQRAAWMAKQEETIRRYAFLPSHRLEETFEDSTSNDLFRLIVEFIQQHDLALVLLLDDIDGKIRTALSATQLNFLLSLQNECNPCFIMASGKPRGRIPRVIRDKSVGEVVISGLDKADVQSMIQEFFIDSRTILPSRSQALKSEPLLTAERLQELLFNEAMQFVLSESYIEKRAGGSLFRPRSVVGICERIVERVASDFSDIRVAPHRAEVFDAVKSYVRLST